MLLTTFVGLRLLNPTYEAKKDSKEFQSQIKQDLLSLKNDIYIADLGVKSMTKTISTQFH